jgi:hypothetical protein
VAKSFRMTAKEDILSQEKKSALGGDESRLQLSSA